MHWMRTATRVIMGRTHRRRRPEDTMVDQPNTDPRRAYPHQRSPEVEAYIQEQKARMDQEDREYDQDMAPILERMRDWSENEYQRNEADKQRQQEETQEHLRAYMAMMDAADAEWDATVADFNHKIDQKYGNAE